MHLKTMNDMTTLLRCDIPAESGINSQLNLFLPKFIQHPVTNEYLLNTMVLADRIFQEFNCEETDEEITKDATQFVEIGDVVFCNYTTKKFKRCN